MKSSYQLLFIVVFFSHYVCVISASCAMPDHIPNATGKSVNETYIEWVCNDGYMMQGQKNAVVWVCLEDGSWRGHNPNCTATGCPSPPIAAYSEINPPLPDRVTLVNETISYACISDMYELTGNTWNRCLPNGSWESDPPICQRVCDTGDRRYNDLICFRTSDTRREWQESFDFCYDGDGTFLVTVKDEGMQNFIAEYANDILNANVWIGAKEGRDWRWRQSGFQIDSYFWEETFPDSNQGDCIALSYQDNSGMFAWSPESSSENNSVLCQYNQSCHRVGLDSSDVSNTTLEYLGACFQFQTSWKTCYSAAEFCNTKGGFLAEILDESINALLIRRALELRDSGLYRTWWIGGYDADHYDNDERSWYWSDKTRVRYEPWRSGRPDNTNHQCVEMRRKQNYMWDDSSCTQERRTLCQIGVSACGDPGQPLHGNRLPDDRTTYSVDATLHFSCNRGYVLSGEDVLTCMNNGTWDSEPPLCEAVTCEETPPEVELASKKVQGLSYQDITIYTCKDGYIPDNEPVSFCQHTGNWSTPNFTCSDLLPGLTTPTILTSSPTHTQSTESQTEISLTTNSPTSLPAALTAQLSTNVQTTESLTEIPKGNSAPSAAIAAGSSVALLFILVLFIITVILVRRREEPKSVHPDDENEMENYTAVANYYEESKPANGDLKHPYYLTVVPESDRNGEFGTPVAKQQFPHLTDAVPKHGKDEHSFIKGSNDRAETEPEEGFVDNVLYVASDEQNGISPSLDSIYNKLANNHDTPSYHTLEDPNDSHPKSDVADEDIYESYEDGDNMVENELYHAPSPTTPRGRKLESVDDQGNGGVYENPDENVYTDCKDGEIMVENELCGARSPTSPRAHKIDAVVDEANDAVYEDPDRNGNNLREEDCMVDNELYGAATPPTTRARYEDHIVVDEVNESVYEAFDDEGSMIDKYKSTPSPTSRAANRDDVVDDADDVYEAVGT